MLITLNFKSKKVNEYYFGRIEQCKVLNFKNRKNYRDCSFKIGFLNVLFFILGLFILYTSINLAFSGRWSNEASC